MVVVGLLIETERGQGNFWCEDKRNNGRMKEQGYFWVNGYPLGVGTDQQA
jgi:hypothetical protein